MTISIKKFSIDGLKLIKRKRIKDNRGYFSRLFCADDLALAGWDETIVQINHSVTLKRGTIRGMHYQSPPCSELKLVSCIKGRIFDVAVDLRRESKTFLQWHKEIISAENNNSFLIPKGCAHGFQTLTDDVELLYCHSAYYNKQTEKALNPHDPRLSISWPLDASVISNRDANHLFIDEFFEGEIY